MSWSWVLTLFGRYVDLQKAYTVLVGNVYKTIYNIMLRRQSEMEEPLLKAVLEKRQRTDVAQDEERFLTRNERELLAHWEKTQMLISQMRLDHLHR